MKQSIRLLSESPFKLVTPSSIIVMTSALSYNGQLESSSRLSKCAPGVDCVLLTKEFHYQRIISNAVLQLFHSLFSKLNKL